MSTVFLLLLFPILALCFEGLLHAAGEVRKDLPSVPEHFASPDWSIYHRTADLYANLIATLASCPSAAILSAHAPPHSPAKHAPPSDDSSSEAIRYITISPPVSLASRLMHRPVRALFVFGETGRDLLTSEVALRVVEKVCSTNDSFSMPNVELVLVPLANPNGRRIAEMGRRCERTNANDVDLDRNWPTFWGYPTRLRDLSVEQKKAVRDAGRVLGMSLGRAPTGDAEQVPKLPPGLEGNGALSEWETRALKAIVEKTNPVSYVNLRTGAVAMTIPWDCREEQLGEGERDRLWRIAEGVAAAHCTRCALGNMWNVTGRTKCGTAADHIFNEGKVSFIHTWHIYHVPEAAKGDCFRKHNPVGREGYERVVENWANAVLNFSTAVHNWVSLEKEAGVGEAEQNATLVAEEAAAKREQDLAKGLPDPEMTEDEKAQRDAEKARVETPHQRGKPSTNGKHGKGGRNASTHDDDPDKLAILTGWLGVWIALFMFAAGMFVVRRFVFKGTSRKKRILRRRPVKNA